MAFLNGRLPKTAFFKKKKINNWFSYKNSVLNPKKKKNLKFTNIFTHKLHVLKNSICSA